MKTRTKLTSFRNSLRSHASLRGSLEAAETLYRSGRAKFRWRAPERSYGFEQIESGSVVVRVPEFAGSFELDARSHLLHRILFAGSFEREAANAVSQTLSEIPPGDCIDIGANAGFYSVLFAKRLNGRGRVLSIEPTQAAFTRLCANLERNNVSEAVTVVRAAVGERPGKLVLSTVAGREEYSSAQMAHQSVKGLDLETEEVDLVRLDDVSADLGLKPVFIKIDIEGGEFAALRGAVQTIDRFRPYVLFEYCPALMVGTDSNPEELLRFFTSRGYSLTWITETEVLAKGR